GCTAGLGTFVSAMTGADTNPGTQAMPVMSIGQGMLNAVTLGGPQTVIVAEGTYGEKVTLAEGIDLQGGYQCDPTSCTWARDTTQHPAIIANIDFEGVLAPAGVTQVTHLDGFRIVGLDGSPAAPPGSAGVSLKGGSPTITRNEIVGGAVTASGVFASDRSIGIALHSTTDPAGVIIQGNDIGGGTSSNLSTGLLFDDYPGPGTVLASVERNVIHGGAGRRSTGITSWNSLPGTIITGNAIRGGNADGGPSSGIEVGSTMTIDSNLINTDQALTCINTTEWCG